MDSIRKWIVKHRNKWFGISSTIGILIILVILMDWIIMPLYTQRGSEYKVPDITEKSFEEAKSILKDHGFRIVIKDEQFHDTYLDSVVLMQDPQPFSKTKKGRRIYVTISAGKKRVNVPRVIGKSERDALFILRQAGLKSGEVFYEFHSYYQKGVVCDQTIPEGDEVVDQTVVDITVSNGKMPSKFIVPDLIGKSFPMADKMLHREGFSLGEVNYEVSNNLIQNTVIGQSVEPGEEFTNGCRIDLVVSRMEDER
ncbi:PASTA domain-containing protein [bacterium]|nr:PASTA domain-containing protein [bacterium]